MIEFQIGEKVEVIAGSALHNKPIKGTDLIVVGFEVDSTVSVLIYNVSSGHEGNENALVDENNNTIRIDRVKYSNYRGFWWVDQKNLQSIDSNNKLSYGKVQSILLKNNKK